MFLILLQISHSSHLQQSIEAAATFCLTAAYAGHTVLNLLFPWAFSKHDSALKNFTLGLSPEDNAAAQQAGTEAGIAVVKDRCGSLLQSWRH